MLSIRAQVDIGVSPERVWRVLMDFAHYRKWHPFVELEGVPSVGSDIDFYFRRSPKAPRGWKGTATVVRFEAPTNFSVKLGVAGLLTVEQWYVLEGLPGGTRVIYGSDYRGILSKIAGGFYRKRLRLLHQLPLDRLAQGFTKAASAATAARETRRPKSRKGFRDYRGK